MKKSELKYKLVLFLVFAILFAAVYSYFSYVMVVDLDTKVVTIVIQPGDGFAKVAGELLHGGVIKSRFVIKAMAKLKGVDTKLVPGRYDFTGENSCRSVLKRLAVADFVRIKVTIPEGNTLRETAAVLAKTLELDPDVIFNLNEDTAFLRSRKVPYLEGYLFPETYFFPWGSNEKAVVTEMIDMFHKQTDSLSKQQAPNNLDFTQALIIASIIEAETGHLDERELVSSVYYNRLRKNMKLDADPTVIYGLGGLDRPLYRNDLQKDSPYNTYMRKGLPPTPINSPGLAAIRAALHPESTDYLFFVADETGRHIFSRTNAEHNRAIQQIRSR